MSVTGSTTVTVTSVISLIFTWTESATSQANNTSTVDWTLVLKSGNGTISSSVSKNWKVTVNGTESSGTCTIGISKNSSKTLASGSTTVKHENDGTKSFAYSFSVAMNYTSSSAGYISTKSGYGTGTLTNLTVEESPEVPKDVVGTTVSVTKPILFDSTATSFTTNGIGTLYDAVSCIVTEERNGSYELEMEYPIDGELYSYITNDRIIYCTPSKNANPQAFRIYRISAELGGTIMVYAQHISYQMCYIPVAPFDATGIANAISGLTTNAVVSCPFTIATDITSSAAYSQTDPSSLRNRLGGEDGSLLDVYGGEWEWDNYTATLHEARGSDRNVWFIYGKNITDLTHESDLTDVVTQIYPYYQTTEDDSTVRVTLSEKVISAATVSDHPFPRTQPVDLTDQFDSKPTEAQLRTKAQEYVTSIGLAETSTEIDVVPSVDDIRLCDTVHISYPKLGINVTAKVTKTTWNVLTNRYDSIEVGKTSSLTSSMSSMSSSITSVSSDVAEVKGNYTSLAAKEASFESATATNFTAVNASITSLQSETATINEVLATKATITDLDAATARITTLESTSATVTDLEAAKARITTLESTSATVTDLSAATARITSLESANTTITGRLDAAEADIDDLEAADATIQALVATKADISDLTAATARITTLESTSATVTDLSAATARITSLESANTTITGRLDAAEADIDDLDANKATVIDLTAATGRITALESDTGNIKNLLAGQAGVGDLTAINLTSANTVIANALITNAMIGSLDASKITSGTIYTDNITIADHQNGSNFIIDGSTLQVKDGNSTVRVQLGEDGDGDYSIYIYDSSGNLLWQPTGITGAGIGTGTVASTNIATETIVNSNIATNAAIAGSKLDIDSVVTAINGSTTTIDAAKVTIDNTTLSAAYSQMTTNISDNASDISDLQSQVSINTNSIATKVSQTEYNTYTTNNDSEITNIKSNYSSLTQTVGGYGERISSVETTLETVKKDVVTYFAVSDNPETYPTLPSSLTESSDWSTTRPIPEYDDDESFVWTVELLVNTDDSIEWTEPVLLTDKATRDLISYEVSSATYEYNKTAKEITERLAKDELKIASNSEGIEQVSSSVSSELKKTAEEYELRFAAITTSLDEKSDKEDVEEIIKHFTASSEGLAFYNDLNGMSMLLSEDKLSFKDNDVTVAYFGNNKEYIKNAQIEDTLVFGTPTDTSDGDWIWTHRSSGHLSLKWIGG